MRAEWTPELVRAQRSEEALFYLFRDSNHGHHYTDRAASAPTVLRIASKVHEMKIYTQHITRVGISYFEHAFPYVFSIACFPCSETYHDDILQHLSHQIRLCIVFLTVSSSYFTLTICTFSTSFLRKSNTQILLTGPTSKRSHV